MKNKKSFTFVETLVVMSVLGLIFPILFTTFFVILRQQLKINRLTEVKRQGDSIVRILEETIKNNAFKIYNNSDTEICDAEGLIPEDIPAYFLNKYNSSFYLDYSDPNLFISYEADPLSPAPAFTFPSGQLNSSKVLISSFSISCKREAQYTSPLVSINFSICYNINETCNSAKPEETAMLEYQTNIKLRTYPTQ